MPLSYSFKQSLRLRKKKDFQQVYKNGKAFVDYAGIIYISRREDDKPSKIGLATGKKLGNAVVRNRMKRLMREVYRKNNHNIKNGFNIIWMARRPLVDADLQTYIKSFLKIFKKANLFVKND